MRTVHARELVHVFYLGSLTALRVIVLLLISSLIWVPLGVVIGLHARASQIIQPIAQFFAAFPVNVLFPFVVLVILAYHLNPSIWLSPLMILGTQWYILFNVVAGAQSLPKHLQQATAVFNVRGWLRWRRLILPGIFPYYITGAITASGGAWNISVIAEAVSWGKTHLVALGLGSYINSMSAQGRFGQLELGILVMSVYVLLINRLLWRPLYNLAEKRFQI